MSKKSKGLSDKEDNIIIEQKITDTLEINYMPYAMSVIVSRAIPEIDGFKPSHRKLLYTMYKMGLLKGDRTKSSNVVGQTMKLNPHGDMAIYETMVRLTTGNEALILPFVDSKGNFGKQYSKNMAFAAPRYTEVKLASVCEEIFEDIDKNTVEFVDNFDGTMKEPLLLPTTFPNILVNPNQGIAVGMASTFCSFNLKQICDASAEYIKDKSVDLLKLIPAPDFPTGGEIIYNYDEFKKIYKTGKGSFKVRAKYKFDKKNSCIDIYEIPYTTTVEAIIDKIIQLVKTNKIKEITDVRDETDLSGLKITIDVKKNTNIKTLMYKLFSMTPLTDSFSCNFNLLINGHPKTLGIYEILDEWILFRINSIKNRIAFDISRKSEKAHLLEGLSKILVDIDKVIKIIRNTEKDSEVIPNLIKGFDIDKIQAEFIAEIKLRNINKEYILNRINELDDLKKEIADLKDTLSSETKVKNIIVKQLKNVSKKYGEERKSTILYEEEIITVSEEELIEDYPVQIFLTKENYFKKITQNSLRMSSDHKLKEDDDILISEETTNREMLLFFSDKSNVYKMKASAFSDTKASSIGDYLPNVLEMEENEKIIYVTSAKDYNGYMIFSFENGKVAKVNISSYETKTNRKKLINGYSLKEKLVRMIKINEDSDIVLIRDEDKATIFNTSLLRELTTKSSLGVQVLSLKKNSKVTKMFTIDEFSSNNKDYYKTNKIPTTGHFLKEQDKKENGFSVQLTI